MTFEQPQFDPVLSYDTVTFHNYVTELPDKEYDELMKNLAARVATILHKNHFDEKEFWNKRLTEYLDPDYYGEEAASVVKKEKDSLEVFKNLEKFPNSWKAHVIENVFKSHEGWKIRRVLIGDTPCDLMFEGGKNPTFSIGYEDDFCFSFETIALEPDSTGKADIDIPKTTGHVDAYGLYKDIDITSQDGKVFINNMRFIHDPYKGIGLSSKIEMFITELCKENDIDLFITSIKTESLAWATKHDYMPLNEQDKQIVAMRFYSFLRSVDGDGNHKDFEDVPLLLKKRNT